MEKQRHNIEDETYSQTPFLLTGEGFAIRSDIRTWVMQGGRPEILLESGLPLWAQTMKWNDPTATEEAVALGAHSNMKDIWHQGWLWWGAQTQMPAHLIMSHLSELDETWWHPNSQGLTPFHHPQLHSAVARAMACRWWSDGLSWRLMQPYGDPIQTARDNSRWDLVALWETPGSLPWFTRP